jgi:DNA adenine methylase (dam)
MPNQPEQSSRLIFLQRSGNGHLTQAFLPGIQIEENNKEAQPFLKWAGGKSQLLSQFDEHFPTSIDRYIEPFLGGGAVFFHLKARFPKMRALLRDNNQELINCYKVVRDEPDALMRRLDDHLTRFLEDRKAYYYSIRRQDLKNPVARAARMIFLNKTCFNGLWRVNASGQFNVPMGSFNSIRLYDRANILAASSALQEVDLKAQDFRKTLGQATKGDFVYIDPPYHPLSQTANFTAYTRNEFGRKEQKELATRFYAASRRGVRLMLSNSNTPLIRKLYARFERAAVRARRLISAQGKNRRNVSEFVILNYSDNLFTRLLGKNSVRFWLLENGYEDVAQLIDEVLLDWQENGKATRRNWWEILAGDQDGNPRRINGREFPVLRAARIRQNLPVTKGCICRNKKETVPGLDRG